MTGKCLTVFCFAGLAAFAQPGAVDVRRADIRGGGGSGKCTIEVVVDGVAEVEVRGDTARLRTVSGTPAQFRRFVCNQVMPPNPGEFRFHGIDGRGRQELVRDPGRGGAAVVRIEDPKSGREGYTFDLEWRGTAGGEREFSRGGGEMERGAGGGGWRGARGGTFSYRGDGHGFFNRREGRDMRVRDVNVNLAADGRVRLEFEAEGFERLVFIGNATFFSREYITAELAAGAGTRNVRGKASIYVDAGGEVDRITMQGIVDGDPFRLTWRARQ